MWNPSSEQLQILATAQDYRHFILLVIELRTTENRKFGFADIARHGNFKSRSFPRDVANNLKNISLNSIAGFCKGMGLTEELADYFALLVEMEHDNCRKTARSPKLLQKLLLKTKQNLKSKSEIRAKKANFNTLFKVNTYPKVYAALGSYESGASLAEITQRTKLESADILNILQQFIELKIVEFNVEKDRYFVQINHVDLSNISDSNFFKNFFLETLQESISISKSKFQDKDKLFFASCFSVNKQDLPALTYELKDLLLNFINRNEISDGNDIVNLLCSLSD